MVFETDCQSAKHIRFMLVFPEPQVHHPAPIPTRISHHSMNNDQQGAEHMLRPQLQQAALTLVIQK